MDPARRSLLWYLLVGTRGGPNRLRVLERLRLGPENAHQLSRSLGLDYRTTRHHLSLLVKAGVVVRPVGDAYGSPYELSPDTTYEFEILRQLAGQPRRMGRRFPDPTGVRG